MTKPTPAFRQFASYQTGTVQVSDPTHQYSVFNSGFAPPCGPRYLTPGMLGGYGDEDTDMSGINWVDLNQTEIDYVRNIHFRDSMASSCRTQTINFLFGEPIKFETSKGRLLELTPEFEAFVKTRWTKFAIDCYDSLQTIGIIPVTIVQPQNGTPYPAVPKEGTYRIQVAYIIEREELIFRVLRDSTYSVRLQRRRLQESTSTGDAYGFQRSHSAEAAGADWDLGVLGEGGVDAFLRTIFNTDVPQGWVLDESVSVLHGFGLDPTVDGRLRSPLVPTILSSRTTSYLGDAMLASVDASLHRTLLVQSTKDPEGKEEDMAGFRGGQFAPRDMGDTAGDSEKFELTDAGLRALRRQHRMFQAFFENPHGLAVSDQLEMQQVPEGSVSILPIPQGYALPGGQQVRPDAGQFYAPFKEDHEEIVSTTYGMAIGLYRNRGQLRGNMGAQNLLLRKTLNSNAKIISRVLTVKYQQIFGNYDVGIETEVTGRKAFYDVDRYVRQSNRTLIQSTDGHYIRNESDRVAPPPVADNKGDSGGNHLSEIFQTSTEDDDMSRDSSSSSSSSSKSKKPKKGGDRSDESHANRMVEKAVAISSSSSSSSSKKDPRTPPSITDMSQVQKELTLARNRVFQKHYERGQEAYRSTVDRLKKVGRSYSSGSKRKRGVYRPDDPATASASQRRLLAQMGRDQSVNLGHRPPTARADGDPRKTMNRKGLGPSSSRPIKRRRTGRLPQFPETPEEIRSVKEARNSSERVRVIIDTGNYAEPAILKYAFDTGSITLDEFRRAVRAFAGFTTRRPEMDTRELDRVMDQDILVKDPFAPPPDISTTSPSGEMRSLNQRMVETHDKKTEQAGGQPARDNRKKASSSSSSSSSNGKSSSSKSSSSSKGGSSSSGNSKQYESVGKAIVQAISKVKSSSSSKSKSKSKKKS